MAERAQAQLSFDARLRTATNTCVTGGMPARLLNAALAIAVALWEISRTLHELREGARPLFDANQLVMLRKMASERRTEERRRQRSDKATRDIAVE